MWPVQFVNDVEDPHAKRLANWIVEKMGGDGRPWSKERAHRSVVGDVVDSVGPLLVSATPIVPSPLL